MSTSNCPDCATPWEQHNFWNSTKTLQSPGLDAGLPVCQMQNGHLMNAYRMLERRLTLERGLDFTWASHYSADLEERALALRWEMGRRGWDDNPSALCRVVTTW